MDKDRVSNNHVYKDHVSDNQVDNGGLVKWRTTHQGLDDHEDNAPGAGRR